MDIMERIPAMTGGRVRVGSGTLYNLLEQFAEAGMIRETKAEGRRRRLCADRQGERGPVGGVPRICAQAWDYRGRIRRGGAAMKDRKWILFPFPTMTAPAWSAT